MPAEILLAGGRLDSIVPIGTPTESSTAALRDTTYTDSAILCTGTGVAIDCKFFTETVGVLSDATVVSGEKLFCHFEFYYSQSSLVSAINNIWIISDSSNFPWFRLSLTFSNTFQGQYNSGTGASPIWTDVGLSWTFNSQVLYTIDIKLTLGSPHAYEFSVNNSLILSGAFTQASFTNAAKLRLSGVNVFAMAYSQILCTRDVSTIGAKVKTCRATADGANTAWTGVFSDVNEAIGSDVTVNSSATAGQKETHAMGDVTIPAGFTLPAIFHWLRAKNDGVAPNNIKSVLRSGAVDYSTGNLSGIGTSFGAIGARYTQDPATVAAWTQVGFNALEAGYESAA